MQVEAKVIMFFWLVVDPLHPLVAAPALNVAMLLPYTIISLHVTGLHRRIHSHGFVKNYTVVRMIDHHDYRHGWKWVMNIYFI